MEIKLAGHKYFISKHKIQTDSNYNIMVHIAKDSKKNIISGWNEREETDNYTILTVAIKLIKKFETPVTKMEFL